MAVAVILALRGAPVEQAAGDVGRIELAGLLILELVQAAFAAAVAQRLPLAAVELGERLRFPEPVGSFHPALDLVGDRLGALVGGSSASGLPSGSIR